MDVLTEILNSQEGLKLLFQDANAIYTKAKFGPSKLTKIPLNINEELAFFIATMIGDGHLRKSKFQLIIELSDLNLMKYIKEICINLFNREFNICTAKMRPGRKQTFVMCLDSKAIYRLLEKVFEIPPGKKSHIVKVPMLIKNSTKEIKIAFLQGIMATEGGRRRHGFGLSTASKQLWGDLIRIFEEVEIPILTDKWEHKKYKKHYYGIMFKKEYMESLMWVCRSGQTG